MANIYSYQVLNDTNQRTVIKLTGLFDGTGQEANTVRIRANTLFGALDANGVPLYSGLSRSNTPLSYYDLSISRVSWSTNIPGTITLNWNATAPANAVVLSGSSMMMDQANWAAINNNAGAGRNGDIGIVTTGAVANSGYTIVLELKKNAQHFSRGQHADPAAFNYPPYGVTP